MAKEQNFDTKVTEVSKGLHTDTSPLNQPKGTYRFALNAVNEASDGQHGFLSNEKSNYSCSNIPDGFNIIGDRYIEDDTSAVILVNTETGGEQIGLINKDNLYTTIVDTLILGLKITNQCDVIYRLRRAKEKVIYWVDSLNRPRTFNFGRPYDFYNQTFQAYIRGGGDPNTYIGEKWDASSFDLIKSYSSVPFFSDVEVIETGQILTGSYNFAIQYVDADFNPTDWITTSNTVNIFNDSLSNPFGRIRGSRNVNTIAQSFPRTNKSIKLTLTNLDLNFPYYRLAIIQANGNTGKVNKVLVSELFSTTNSIFIYTGNDSSLIETALGDILINKEVIFAPQHIEQIENRLLLADTKGKGVNWCEFQKFASKISSDLVTKDIILNSIASDPNIKNVNSTFLYRGYMPGEVYSFAIVYLFDDGTLSPAFHIPGISQTNTFSLMRNYEIVEQYLDIHNCSVDNYWGKDSEGNGIVGNNIRHHRFPFRKQVNKPLVGTTNTSVNISKYKLTISIALNPAWTTTDIDPDTGSPYTPFFPRATDGSSLAIGFGIDYQVVGTPSVITFNGTIIASDVVPTPSVIEIYNDTIALDIIDTPEYGELNPASQLASYQDGVNDRFIITFAYASYVDSQLTNVDESTIFGIKFSAIEKPMDGVIGFYIVRNERGTDDRLILDNAIFGPMTSYQQYKSFGLLTPKQYYTANNCGVTEGSGKTLGFWKKGTWFFNPEYQFNGTKIDFSRIEVEGSYAMQAPQMPTVSNIPNSTCNGGHSRGVYINDVQAGTSYDPNVNKRKYKDDDGFDLLIGYRNTNVTYSINNSVIYPAKKKVIYLNAASYLEVDQDIAYNVSVDNKIGMYLTDDNIWNDILNPLPHQSTFADNLIYGSMVTDNDNLYANFINRPYFKEHNNPVLFGGNTVVNDFEVYNGDAQISAATIVSSVFYDIVVAQRPKKSGLWKIIVGAILTIAAIAATILTAGAASPLIPLAISYGISLAVSGIKFEQFKSMIDVDYEKGLRETVVDGGVYETIRDSIERYDDTIRWFCDRVSNVYIESSVPFGLRSGMTCGVPDFIDSPIQYDENGFRTYITEKLTTLDRDQGSGRLYKGFASAEYYDMNPDFTRFNKEKQFSHLPIEYDCCADSKEIFPMRIWYSEQSFQEEKLDNYGVFLPNNYKDIEGEHGEITDLYRLGNALFVHTREALWQLPQDVQERVTSEIISFIGTGSFFSIPPRKVVDDSIGSGGSQHKWATIKTKNGVIFLNEIENKIYLHSSTVKDISIIGIRNWFENNLKSFLSAQIYNQFGVNYPYDNNPANPGGIGYLATYDVRYERIIVTKKDYLYLGDLDDLIVNPDTSEEYPDGTVIITETGFKVITSTEFTDPITDDFSDWQEEVIPLQLQPTLVPPATIGSPMILNYGIAYTDTDGSIVYKSKTYADLAADPGTGFVDGTVPPEPEFITDTIPVNVNSCVDDTIEINILNLIAKKCPNVYDAGGFEVRDTRIILGDKPGVFKFIVNTLSIPDSFKIYYGEIADGILMFDSATLPTADPMTGCVSTNDMHGDVGYPPYAVCLNIYEYNSGGPGGYNAAIFLNWTVPDPLVQHITVHFEGCEVDTAWRYKVGCVCNSGNPVNPEDMVDWNYCEDCSS